MKNIINALNKGARLSYGDKWLCAEDLTDVFVVYERKYAQKKSRVLIETTDLDNALKILMKIEGE